MKKVFLSSMVLISMIACNQPQQKQDQSMATADSTSKGPDMNALYQKNLATVQAQITAFENEDIDAWASAISDTVTWFSPAYGDTVTTKAHWKETVASYVANWDSLKLKNPIFLPGIDQDTHQLDGSVRYYGQWYGIHKSGKRTWISFYGTYTFNADGKISQAAEFFDVGGLMKAVSGK